jgi:PAS domain S-box-containing protein
MFAADREGVITLAEGKGLEALGLKPDQVIGQSIFDIYRDTPQVMENFHRALAGDSFMSMAEVGGVMFEAWETPLRDQNDEITGITGVVTDITERKEAEEALRAERDRAQKYLDVAEVIIVAINAKGQVTLINPKGCAVLGYEEKDILGRDWFDLILPATLRREVRAVFRKLMAGEIEPVEYYENPIRTERGEERLIAWHNAVLRDDAGDIVGTLSSGEDVTERRRAEEALREREGEMRQLTARLLDVQEEERRAVARELHDEIGQLLTGLSLTLETCVSSPRQANTDLLRETQGSVDELISRVSDLSLDLRPAMLDDLGLLPALLWHLERYASRTGVRVDFKHNGLEGRFAPEVETAAYRIIQEALTNVARHAGVSETTVRLWADQDTLLVRIEDQGTGFDPTAVLAAGHASGLAGMQERAALCGGQLTVDSEPGGGTRLALELPAGVMTPREKR